MSKSKKNKKPQEQPEPEPQPELPDEPTFETVVREVHLLVYQSRTKTTSKVAYSARYNPYDDTVTFETRIPLVALDMMRTQIDDVKKKLDLKKVVVK